MESTEEDTDAFISQTEMSPVEMRQSVPYWELEHIKQQHFQYLKDFVMSGKCAQAVKALAGNENEMPQEDTLYTEEEVDAMISEIMERTAWDVAELRDLIHCWEAESATSYDDSYIETRIQRYLKDFFEMRRKDAEHRGENCRPQGIGSTEAPSTQCMKPELPARCSSIKPNIAATKKIQKAVGTMDSSSTKPKVAATKKTQKAVETLDSSSTKPNVVANKKTKKGVETLDSSLTKPNIAATTKTKKGVEILDSSSTKPKVAATKKTKKGVETLDSSLTKPNVATTKKTKKGVDTLDSSSAKPKVAATKKTKKGVETLDSSLTKPNVATTKKTKKGVDTLDSSSAKPKVAATKKTKKGVETLDSSSDKPKVEATKKTKKGVETLDSSLTKPITATTNKTQKADENFQDETGREDIVRTAAISEVEHSSPYLVDSSFETNSVEAVTTDAISFVQDTNEKGMTGHISSVSTDISETSESENVPEKPDRKTFGQRMKKALKKLVSKKVSSDSQFNDDVTVEVSKDSELLEEGGSTRFSEGAKESAADQDLEDSMGEVLWTIAVTEVEESHPDLAESFSCAIDETSSPEKDSCSVTLEVDTTSADSQDTRNVQVVRTADMTEEEEFLSELIDRSVSSFLEKTKVEDDMGEKEIMDSASPASAELCESQNVSEKQDGKNFVKQMKTALKKLFSKEVSSDSQFYEDETVEVSKDSGHLEEGGSTRFSERAKESVADQDLEDKMTSDGALRTIAVTEVDESNLDLPESFSRALDEMSSPEKDSCSVLILEVDETHADQDSQDTRNAEVVRTAAMMDESSSSKVVDNSVSSDLEQANVEDTDEKEMMDRASSTSLELSESASEFENVSEKPERQTFVKHMKTALKKLFSKEVSSDLKFNDNETMEVSKDLGPLEECGIMFPEGAKESVTNQDLETKMTSDGALRTTAVTEVTESNLDLTESFSCALDEVSLQFCNNGTVEVSGVSKDSGHSDEEGNEVMEAETDHKFQVKVLRIQVISKSSSLDLLDNIFPGSLEKTPNPQEKSFSECHLDEIEDQDFKDKTGGDQDPQLEDTNPDVMDSSSKWPEETSSKKHLEEDGLSVIDLAFEKETGSDQVLSDTTTYEEEEEEETTLDMESSSPKFSEKMSSEVAFKEDGHTVFSEAEVESTAQQSTLNSPQSTCSRIVGEFFQGLTDKQWRELSEGVYNTDVKEKLLQMCLVVMTFIRDSVFEILSLSMCGSSTSSSEPTMTALMSSEHLMEFVNYDIYSSVETSLSEAFCDVTGGDVPVTIKPEFTEAIVKEVIDKINSSFTTNTQATRVKGDWFNRILNGAISTISTFLTGHGHAIKTRVKSAPTHREPFHGQQRLRTHPVPSEDPEPSRKKGKTKRPLQRRLFCCCC
ncbi:uncharacterized protein LOC124995560 [Mugil cephalus]|uniref:uncharacterized protein LOC124995560 n=1 Tax=Mugil cephalus TaxID=48193 RepID=UPI001FB7BFC6|nr:uncharacterized protein LOC124995560 [Mugil cephalus]